LPAHSSTSSRDCPQPLPEPFNLVRHR
jgi:hypothetical protein